MLYAADLESNALLDEITKIHCFGFKGIGNNDFFVFCRLKELDKEKRNPFEEQGIQFFELDKVTDFFKSKKVKGFSWHNCLGYDLEVIKMFYSIDYDWRGFKDYNHIIEDTYVNSMYLHPDRQLPPNCPSSIKYIDKNGEEKTKKIGPHGLEAWGYRTGTHKPFIEDWRDQPLYVYVNRVIEDCKIQEATHYAQQKEINDVAIPNGSKQGQWKLPLKMAHKTYWLMQEQQRCGVKFDIDGAKKLIKRIDKEMKEIEDDVEPKLGMRVLPDNQQPKFPSSCFKKSFDYNKPFKKTGGLKKQTVDYLNKIGITENQEEYLNSLCEKEEIDGIVICKNNFEEKLPKHPDLLTESAKRYCEKFGFTELQKQFDEIIMLLDKAKDHKIKKYPMKIEEPLKLSHKKDVKIFLIENMKWKPTIFKPRNILIDLKTKQKLPKEKIEQKLNSYIKEFRDSVYWPFILKELGYNESSKVNPDSESFRKKCLKNGRNLISSPQYTDQRGELCPNLIKIDEDIAKKICKWLSLQNRRNTILSKNGTGWLANPRLKIDGRLPAGASGITPTFRKKHTVCVNIPKANEKSILGKEIRSLFISPDEYVNVGGDGVSIEALCASHYTIPFDNGKYSESVLSGSFHNNNAVYYSKAAGFEITRSEGKNITYALTYGATYKKIAKMMSVSDVIAKKMVEAFWEANPGLLAVKEALEKYWKSTGNKYIYGLDGRKVYTRSQHSLTNTLFQHTGALILDYAQCYVHDKIKEKNLDIQRWGEFHDEGQAYENRKEIKVFYFDYNKKPEQERMNLLYSKPKIFRDKKIIHEDLNEDEINKTDKWIQFFAPFGHYLDEGFKEASKFFKTNVEFRVEYMVGKNWMQCH